MVTINSKSQSWSIDIILAVVLFMGAFILFYVLLSNNPNAKAKTLKEEAFVVIKEVSSKDANIRIIDNNEVNISRLGHLKNLTYDELKSILRIDSDFCIFFEDENGRIILINNSYTGTGSSNINLSNVPCSKK